MGASTTWAYYDLFGQARVRGLVSIDQTPKMLNDGHCGHAANFDQPDAVNAALLDFLDTL
jgi:hypothetical protein